MLKVELHSHTADDPHDRIGHTTTELIEHAAALQFDALAITLHDRQLDLARHRAQAERCGIVLIPGIERTIEGKHVLLLNFSPASEQVKTFADLAQLRAVERGVVVAPHPFFPGGSCLGGKLDTHADLFDAVEWNAMFTSRLNFNAAAAAWARKHGKSLVGNGDVHLLEQLGTTYSLVDAGRTADGICDAIRHGDVEVAATPHSELRAAWLFARLVITTMLPREWTPGRSPVADPA